MIKVLYICDKKEDAEKISKHLSSFESAFFELIWQKTAESGLEFLVANHANIEIIVIEDNIEGMSNIEFAGRIKELNYDIPIVFISSNKDVNFAVEAMKVGAKDYILKEDVLSRIFPQSLSKIVEKQRLINEVALLEIKQKRLEAMQEIVADIIAKISEPLERMQQIINSTGNNDNEKAKKYTEMISENIGRMQNKLEKLRNLKDDKTVKYIRDIKMVDLS